MTEKAAHSQYQKCNFILGLHIFIELSDFSKQIFELDYENSADAFASYVERSAEGNTGVGCKHNRRILFHCVKLLNRMSTIICSLNDEEIERNAITPFMLAGLPCVEYRHLKHA